MTDCAWNNPEIEADGFITPLEQLSGSKAKPAAECIYPKCEECDKYHGKHCTVPIVFTKQYYRMIEDFFANVVEQFWKLDERIDELEAQIDVKAHLKSAILYADKCPNPPAVKITKSEEQ